MLFRGYRWQRNSGEDGLIFLRALEKENFLEPRSDPEPDSRSLEESSLFTNDGGVDGGEIAIACWFCAGKRGRADVASGRASSMRRRKTKSFMMMGVLRDDVYISATYRLVDWM